MPTIKYQIDGKRVPSVTTIIGHRKEADGLMHWAWREGMEGRDYRETRDKAADAGTMAHDAIEAMFQGRDHVFPDTKMGNLARMGFEAYELWAEQSRIEIFNTEMNLTSPLFGGFGGTPDAIANMGDRVILLDWKTSNSTYVDHLVQLSAYQHLIDVSDDFPDVDQCHLVRFAKDDGSFHHHHWPEVTMKKGWEMFQHMAELYNLNKQLKRVVK